MIGVQTMVFVQPQALCWDRIDGIELIEICHTAPKRPGVPRQRMEISIKDSFVDNKYCKRKDSQKQELWHEKNGQTPSRRYKHGDGMHGCI